MRVATLTALPRNEKGKKARREGFIPGVVYGREIKSLSVKFIKRDFLKVLKEYGERPRVKLLLDNQERMALVKDIDKEPITGEILHVDLQLVAAGQKITCDIPIKFIGREKLKSKGLILQVNIDSINVTGEASIIPEHFVVDVGDKNEGDAVTIQDLNIHPEIQITDPPEDAIAVVTAAEEEASEEGKESEDGSR
ncbi:large subunit ribosomal protein L25 [Caldicoprobacter guelmensis]|uniref:50S ribosomal protein L25 n=1 Tax=Caldicoprobacter guelmensis TaxID=1170224 RepID=UPI00195D845C|nr:50S ribosomal protein L25 [Caldicoprobacter guelmensis]MBM7582936.1 large subunit ribosomal protein L25 [Caldicoprobacter guelmensis]